MKKVIVRISDNYSIDSATTEILKLYSYLSFKEAFRSFQIITFECPTAYQSNVLNQLTALNVVKRATFDKEAYHTLPFVEDEAMAVETSGTPEYNPGVEGQTTEGTRALTTTGSGTIYVKVQNISGNNYYVFSQTQGGTYTKVPTNLDFCKVELIHLIKVTRLMQVIHSDFLKHKMVYTQLVEQN